jgi:hypothetical protein
MNIAATALNLFLDASPSGLSSAGPAAGALTNIASTLLGGDGTGSNPISDFTNGLAGSIIGILA